MTSSSSLDSGSRIKLPSLLVFNLECVTIAHSFANPSTCSASLFKNDFGIKTAVEVSMTKIANSTLKQISFVIREISRAEQPVPTRPALASNDNNPSVAELVGSASLKEIVAETTDVIEKICIQTAIETTNNNKAAAAEMLGLSRQSLYVKLHKYGLVDTEES